MMPAGSRIRRAMADDLPAILALLSDDALGHTREGTTEARAAYDAAFAAIEHDPNNLLFVLEEAGTVFGCFQLTFIPGLSRKGALRGQIESVRIAAERRGERLGEAMMQWAIDECRRRGCKIVQLTTDRSRADAHRFYERLGFASTHLGMKLEL